MDCNSDMHCVADLPPSSMTATSRSHSGSIMSPRTTCKDPRVLIEAFKQHVVDANMGASLLSESPDRHEVRKVVTSQIDFLKSLKKAVPNLSATEPCVYMALQQALRDNRLIVQNSEEWCHQMGDKVRQLMRVVQQLCLAKTKWFQALHIDEERSAESAESAHPAHEADAQEEEEECADDADLEGEEEEQEEEEEECALLDDQDKRDDVDTAEEASAAAMWSVGYDVKKRKAYRVPAEDAEAPEDYCSRMYYPEGALKSDAMMAAWPDGMTSAIATVTVGRWNAMTRGSKDVLQTSDGLPVSVRFTTCTSKDKKTKDRFVQLMHAGQVVFRCHVRHFANDEDAAKIWCSEIAQRFARGELDRTACTAMKDSKISAEDAATQKRPAAATSTLKRPAAAIATQAGVAQPEQTKSTPAAAIATQAGVAQPEQKFLSPRKATRTHRREPPTPTRSEERWGEWSPIEPPPLFGRNDPELAHEIE